MSTVITGSRNYSSSSTIPSFGDLGSAYPAVVGAAFQRCMNNTAYMEPAVTPFVSGGLLTLGGDLEITGHNVSIDTTLTVGGFSCESNFNVDSDAIFNGNLTLQDLGKKINAKLISMATGSVIDGGATTMNLAIKPGVNGRRPGRVAIAPDADHVFTWGDGGVDIVYINNITTTRTFAFDATGALDGASITIVNNDNASSCFVTAGDGGDSLITLTAGNSCQIIYFVTELNWRLGLH